MGISEHLRAIPGGPGVFPLSPGNSGGDRRGENAPRELAQACQEVEELFLTQLLGAMRRTLLTGLKKSSGQAEKYQTLADQEVARVLAAGGGLGLARTLYQHLAGKGAPRPERESHGVPNPEPSGDPGGAAAAAAGVPGA